MPDVEVTVVPDAAHAPATWIAQRKLDVALVAGKAKPPPRVRVTPLFRDELVAVVGKRHPWAARRTVEPRAFLDEHVWADEGTFRPDEPLGRALIDAGHVQPRKVTLVPMTGTVHIDMARAGLGVTLAPRWAIEAGGRASGVVPVRIGARGLWLDWAIALRDEDPEPSLAAFVATMRSHHPRTRKSRRHMG